MTRQTAKSLIHTDAVNVSKALALYEAMILDPTNRQTALMTRAWSKAMPNRPGVYAWFEQHQLIYVGETGQLSDRLDDARRTANHSLRRSLGHYRFSKHEGFRRATTKQKFPPHIEVKLDNLMKRLTVSVLPVSFGRKELEEYLVEKHRPLHNQKMRQGA